MKTEKPAVQVTGKLEWVGPWQSGQPLPKELVRELAEILAQMLVAEIKEHAKPETTKVPTTASISQRNLSLPKAAKRSGVSLIRFVDGWLSERSRSSSSVVACCSR